MLKLSRVVLIIIFVFCISSCKVSQSYVGGFNPDLPSKVECKDKGIYLFWDLVQLQSIENKCDAQNYEKVVRRNLFDNVVYYGTLGIFSFYTVKIKVNKPTDKKEE